MAEPDYKQMYEKLQKKVEKLETQRDAYYAVEEAFLEWMEKRFDNEYYRELWNEIDNIVHSHYTRKEITEEVMERNIKKIEIEYYFPYKNTEEEETEENYRKYRGED